MKKILLFFILIQTVVYSYTRPSPQHFVKLYEQKKIRTQYTEHVLNSIFRSPPYYYHDGSSLLFYSRYPGAVVVDTIPETHKTFRKISDSCYYARIPAQLDIVYSFKYIGTEHTQYKKWQHTSDNYPYYAQTYSEISLYDQEQFAVSEKNVQVYLPKNYENRRQDYSVLFVWNTDDLLFRTRLISILTYFISHTVIEPCIVIVANSNEFKTSHDMNVLMRAIHDNYRTDDSRLFAFVRNISDAEIFTDIVIPQTYFITHEPHVHTDMFLSDNIQIISLYEIKNDGNNICIPHCGSVTFSFMQYMRHISDHL